MAEFNPVDLSHAKQFLEKYHYGVLATRRKNGNLQMSPVTCGLSADGRAVISSRETAYKVNNLRRPRAALCVFTPNFHGEGWVQINGSAEIISLPAALDTLVYLQRQAYGEHKSWPEFHERMVREKRVIIRINIENCGPDGAGLNKRCAGLASAPFFVVVLWLAPARANGAEANKFLAGQLLVASTEMKDPRFAESVIYMVEHDAKGAFGLIINQPAAKGSIRDLLKGFGIDNDNVGGDIVLHFGGPVNPRGGFILHSDELTIEGTKKVRDGLAVTADARPVEMIGEGKGPQQYLLMLGYAGWAPGQLEGEILAGSWHTIPGDKALIFSEGADTKWRQAMERRLVPL